MIDPTYVSALNANRLLRECMTGVAMRKKGLTEPHYLSPLTASPAQEGPDRAPLPEPAHGRARQLTGFF